MELEDFDRWVAEQQALEPKPYEPTIYVSPKDAPRVKAELEKLMQPPPNHTTSNR